MAKTKTKTKTKTTPLSIPVLPAVFGNLNVGDKSARLGVTFRRTDLTVSDADSALCGQRLTVFLVARTGGAQAAQDSIPGLDDDLTISGVADVKSFGVSKKTITAGLTFAIESADIPTLAKFARQEGTMLISAAAAIPEEDDHDSDQ